MEKFKAYWKSAAAEVKNVRSLTGAALVSAMGPILAMMTIIVNQYLQIGFSSLVHAVNGMMFGPVLAGLAGGVSDIIKFIIKPTGPFFPGFTLNEILTGVIYGLFFYKREIKLRDIMIARVLVTVGINLLLTPLWLSVMYGKAFTFMVPARLIKNIVMLPIDVFLLHTVLNFTKKVKQRLSK